MLKRKPKISLLNAVGLTATAVIFDLVGMALNLIGVIPFIGQAIAWPLTSLLGLTALVVFGVWFLVLGIGFVNPKQIAGSLIGAVVELIPVLNFLPGFTVAILITLSVLKSEEIIGVK